jgi:hypothetical protein
LEPQSALWRRLRLIDQNSVRGQRLITKIRVLLTPLKDKRAKQNYYSLMERDEFRTLLKCPCCQELGAVTWEENSYANPQGAQRRLVAVHGEFHSEIGRRSNSGDPLIVCNTCDTIQED